jgi:hypothetical protein
MKNILIGLALGGVIAFGVAACSGQSIPLPNPPSGGGGGTTTTKYQQIELLSRPAVKEAFETFSDHDTTNRAEPYNDPTLQGEIGTFTTTVAGRSAPYATALQSILYPNEMVADLSQSATTAAYLGVETGGATGSKFGGRALKDDAIDISLGAIFGTTLSDLGVVKTPDGKQSPCLETDHVSYQSTTSSTFPYAQAPI